jgi:hypothetical protein
MENLLINISSNDTKVKKEGWIKAKATESSSLAYK